MNKLIVVSIAFLALCATGACAGEKTEPDMARTAQHGDHATSDAQSAVAAGTVNTGGELTPLAKKKNEPVCIVTSFYPMYIETLNIAKDIPNVTVTNLTKPQTGCLHDYQMTTEDMRTLAKADIFVANGAGMEAFLGKVLAELPNLRIIQASEGIALIKGAGDTGDNPHVWVSVTLCMKQVETIEKALAAIDPAHADAYAKNAAAYLKKLETLKVEMHKDLQGIISKDIITFHEAFPYFAQEFGLNIAAVIEREPGAEPSAKELAETILLVRKAKIKALFAEPQYPAKAAQTIARETGATVWTLDPGVTGADHPDAYITIMRSNRDILKKALK